MGPKITRLPLLQDSRSLYSCEMQIARFRVERYRSIKKAESIDLTTLTVLVGPNNEGKSNILRALVVGLDALSAVTQLTRSTRPRPGVLQGRLDDFNSYKWERDFPIELQNSTPKASSTFEFEFLLDREDIAAFKKLIGPTLNGRLKMRVLVSRTGVAQVKVVKSGPGSAELNSKTQQIASFVAARIRVEYIPTARTYEQSYAVIRREAATVLRGVTDTPEYQKAAGIINGLVSNALAPLEEKLLNGIQAFIPEVAEVSIKTTTIPGRIGIPDLEVDIDDGQRTALSAKGDGVQSLVALSLVRMMTKKSDRQTYILAVEEPEAHLHPGAVHKLREIMDDISRSDQVILTTHSPILVRRDDPTSNILVYNNAAAPAKTLERVRESLGIKLPDNMASAELVLLVEGKHDRALISHLLRVRNGGIKKAIDDGRLEVRHAGGATNIPYQYRLFRDSICAVHVLLDGDTQGRRARSSLDRDEGLLPADATMITAADMNESELEDLFLESSFSAELLGKYNVTIEPSITQPEKRFALRMKDYFAASGQLWSDSVESNVKAMVSAAIIDLPALPLDPRRIGVVNALESAIATKLRI